MQRRSWVPGAAAAAAIGLALSGCTSDDGAAEATAGKPGSKGAAASSAPSGKYRTLPEPCGSVDRDTLRRLLPGEQGDDKPATEEDRKAEDKDLEGKAKLTHDTDRRVGCEWTRSSGNGSRHLTVDFERIVSYATNTSDVKQAEKIFASRAEEHKLDLAGPPAGPPGPGDSPSSASPSASDDTETLSAPRHLAEPGDQALLADVQGAAASEAGRTVTVVFRTSNVLVTVVYSHSPAEETTTPDSKELQERTRQLAGTLAERFDG